MATQCTRPRHPKTASARPQGRPVPKGSNLYPYGLPELPVAASFVAAGGVQALSLAPAKAQANTKVNARDQERGPHVFTPACQSCGRPSAPILGLRCRRNGHCASGIRLPDSGRRFTSDRGRLLHLKHLLCLLCLLILTRLPRLMCWRCVVLAPLVTEVQAKWPILLMPSHSFAAPVRRSSRA